MKKVYSQGVYIQKKLNSLVMSFYVTCCFPSEIKLWILHDPECHYVYKVAGESCSEEADSKAASW